MTVYDPPQKKCRKCRETFHPKPGSLPRTWKLKRYCSDQCRIDSYNEIRRNETRRRRDPIIPRNKVARSLEELEPGVEVWLEKGEGWNRQLVRRFVIDLPGDGMILLAHPSEIRLGGDPDEIARLSPISRLRFLPSAKKGRPKAKKKARATNRETRKERRLKKPPGSCHRCWKPAVEGMILCEEHREINRQHQREYRRKKRESSE